MTDGLLRRMGWTFREGVQEELRVLNCSAAVEVEVESTGPVAEVGSMWRDLRHGAIPDRLGSRIGAVLGDLGGVARGAWRKHVSGTYVNRPVRWVGLTLSLDPLPVRDSRVLLGPNRDALGVPLARLYWRLDPADGRSMGELARRAAAELTRLGSGRVKLHPDLADESGAWIDRWNLVGHDEAPDAPTGFISWHHMGTTRMATDPARGVVDAHCRVFSVPNLYVAGASVFPTVGHGNPTMTIVALAVRLARHLEGELVA